MSHQSNQSHWGKYLNLLICLQDIELKAEALSSVSLSLNFDWLKTAELKVKVNLWMDLKKSSDLKLLDFELYMDSEGLLIASVLLDFLGLPMITQILDLNHVVQCYVIQLRVRHLMMPHLKHLVLEEISIVDWNNDWEEIQRVSTLDSALDWKNLELVVSIKDEPEALEGVAVILSALLMLTKIKNDNYAKIY